MLDPKKQALMDQAVTGTRELYPPMWWAAYSGCLEEGFTPQQAITMVQSFIMSMSASITVFPAPQEPPEGE